MTIKMEIAMSQTLMMIVMMTVTFMGVIVVVVVEMVFVMGLTAAKVQSEREVLNLMIVVIQS